jgi:hypothetical protein
MHTKPDRAARREVASLVSLFGQCDSLRASTRQAESGFDVRGSDVLDDAKPSGLKKMCRFGWRCQCEKRLTDVPEGVTHSPGHFTCVVIPNLLRQRVTEPLYTEAVR